jgi:ribosomal protein S18 acetylase RimI-like enzyme
MAQVPPADDQITREDIDDALVAHYARQGYHLIFAEEVMLRDLRQAVPQPTMPASVVFQTWTADRASAFFAAYSGAFRDRPGFPGWSEDRWVNWIADDPTFRADRSEVVLVGDEPVGFIANSDDEDHPAWGYIIQVGTVPSWRGRGLARALILRALHAWQAEGKTDALLHVNVNNPGAIRLYEQLGFAHIARRGRFARSQP